jgi:hypothetical protein
MLFAPVLAGYWSQREISDGTYDLDDLLDIMEAMQVSAENQRRADEAAKQEAELRHGQ